MYPRKLLHQQVSRGLVAEPARPRVTARISRGISRRHAVTVVAPTLAQADSPCPDEQDFHWRTAVEQRIGGMELRKESTGGFGSFRVRDLGDLLITDWECPQIEGIRGGNFIRRDDDALLLFTASAGKQILECEDRTVVLRPGAVLITSTRVPTRFLIPH